MYQYHKTNLSLLILIVIFFGQILSVEAATATSTVEQNVSPSSTTTGHDAMAVEKKVREYFADIPVMIEIAKCESNFRQFTDGGNVLLGGAGGTMVGIFQFFESIHTNTARALGLDIRTVEGNIAYARHLYTQSGTLPWSACVPAHLIATASAVTVTPVAVSFTETNLKLKIELLQKVVVLLQELLKLELAKNNQPQPIISL